MEIRRAQPDDADQLATLYIQSAERHTALDPDFYRTPDFEEVAAHYRRLLGKEEADALFVADDEGIIVGMVKVGLESPPQVHSMLVPGRIARADIVVTSDHRRRGIGSALMERAQQWASEQGAEAMMLDMLAANRDALAFYERVGYQIHGLLLLKRPLRLR